MPSETYNKKFDVGVQDSKKLAAAFAQVSDIRKFEIELYWKRATYFWTLIAVAFAGYFAILAAEKIPNKFFLSFVVASIGLVFTFAWYLANRGSKYWQENWENHLDLLEDSITGPLYKTLLERPEWNSFCEKFVTGPLSVSVSKINQWVSVFVLFIWLNLLMFSGYKTFAGTKITLDDWLRVASHTIVVITAAVCCWLMVHKGKTHKDQHNPVMRERKTIIKKKV